MRNIYNLYREPQDSNYKAIIDMTSKFASYFLVVIRYSVKMNKKAEIILNALRPFIESSNDCNEWPGTKLTNEFALVNVYNLNYKSLEIIKGSVSNLYDWLQPSLPEDICFLRADKSPFLVTISHEKDGYLELYQREYNELINTYPELGKLININS
ncbi:MAG: hypothetical protein KJ620_02610 [Candidatus Edwardsbacteria bacterium]|nr:hypothetical protein [Candidatus Edwardsbacteria bacterium]MBU1576007.1 hypothetical protein [Candidatus Edwardsbacteria bacterium]MBU2463930.1 hypothetical protein [Candidatus Edwardsbacteria bacterium]